MYGIHQKIKIEYNKNYITKEKEKEIACIHISNGFHSLQ